MIKIKEMICKVLTYFLNRLQSSEVDLSSNSSTSHVLYNSMTKQSSLIVDVDDVINSLDNNTTVQESTENRGIDDYDFIRTKTLFEDNYQCIIGASLRGRSHIESNTECQDYHMYLNIAEGWHLYIISDGAGSAKYSGRGSKANCSIFSKLIVEVIRKNDWLSQNALPTELDWHLEFRSICERMKLLYREKADEETVEDTDFNATLMVCLQTPLGIMCGHIGDGRMGYLSQDNIWGSMMKPHKGEEANQTIFLQNNWTKPRIPILKISGVYVPETRILLEQPKAIILMSDGCERSAWQCSIYDSKNGKYSDVNKPHPEFLNPLIESIITEKEDKMSLFIDIMDKGTKTCEQERDDKTMLLAIMKESYELSDL